MTERPHNLKQIQAWMQAVITHPQGVRAGASSEAARRHLTVPADELDRVVTPSSALTANQRLGIYSHAYFARLQECLRAEFPVLLHALDDELFNRFTFEYLQYYPSRSYTLNRLGEDFPRYLAETRPDCDAPPDARESWPDFIIDLAILERAFSEVFDGPGVEKQTVLAASQLSSLSDEELAQARFVPVVCLRLLSFRYPVTSYFNAVRSKENPDLPAPFGTFVAMTRRDYVVRLYELSREQHDLLGALMAGQPFARVMSTATEETNGNQESSKARADGWLRDWVDNGFFGSIKF
jgi:hypothetical protein